MHADCGPTGLGSYSSGMLLWNTTTTGIGETHPTHLLLLCYEWVIPLIIILNLIWRIDEEENQRNLIKLLPPSFIPCHLKMHLWAIAHVLLLHREEDCVSVLLRSLTCDLKLGVNLNKKLINCPLKKREMIGFDLDPVPVPLLDHDTDLINVVLWWDGPTNGELLGPHSIVHYVIPKWISNQLWIGRSVRPQHPLILINSSLTSLSSPSYCLHLLLGVTKSSSIVAGWWSGSGLDWTVVECRVDWI